MTKPFRELCEVTVRQLYGMREVKGDVGIEIELEGTGPLGTPVRGWDTHEEGSLRAPGGVARGGAEYVTHGPVKHDAVIQRVQALVDVLNDNGIVVDETAHRTSTHIHVNVQNMPVINVLGFLVIFATVEPLLMHLCGHKRNGNSFCAASYETGDMPEWMHDYCKAIERSGTHGMDMWQRGKYASLGTFRLQDLGTLEARTFPHSINPEQIHLWCTWMLNIRSMASTNEDKSFRNIVKEGMHNPIMLSDRIFGFINLPAHQIADLLMLGSQEAYELTRILKRFLKRDAPAEKEAAPKTKKKLFGVGLRGVADTAPAPANWGDLPQIGQWDAGRNNPNGRR